MESNNNRIFLGFGANLGDRAAAIHGARAALAENGWEEFNFSGLFETPPWGNTDQPAFLNAVAEGRWGGSPAELLRRLMQIETVLGRERMEKWGPRQIDIDILCFGKVEMETQRLTIPHPFLDRRAFVLVPWNSIAPQFVVPGREMRIDQLLELLPEEDRLAVKRIEEGIG
jgi:2-amino-4-hydroxy-6-hydroxymethyldihydropteridine diphosphokinase